ncbi:MAG: InlB B-repeat-containing protein [Actinomycetales bacterium]|nr:InlB B-repeat-containing protein [Actinomycetales bacterium]
MGAEAGMNDSPTSMLEGPSRSGRAWRRLRWAVGLLALAIVVAGIGLGPQRGRQGTAAPALGPVSGLIAPATGVGVPVTYNPDYTCAVPFLDLDPATSAPSSQLIANTGVTVSVTANTAVQGNTSNTYLYQSNVRIGTTLTFSPAVPAIKATTRNHADAPGSGFETLTFTGTGGSFTAAVTNTNGSFIYDSGDEFTGMLSNLGVAYTWDAGAPPLSRGSYLDMYISCVGVTPTTQTVTATTGSPITATSTFTQKGFLGNMSYAVTSGSLPAGLSLDSTTGVISGTPTAPSSGSITVSATGSSFGTATTSVTFNITGPSYYSVTYDGNGATGGTVPTGSGSYASGSNVTVLGNTGTLVRGGYAFEGWTTDAAGTATKYVGGDTFAISSNTTLYALWSPFSVTYDGNGSTGGTVPVDSTAYTSSATATVLGNTGSLVRTGFTFAGWATDAVGAGTVYQAGASYPLSGKNVVFYAKWAAVPAPAPPAPPAPGPAPSSAEPEPSASSAPPVPAPSPSASPELVIIQNQDNGSVPPGAGVAPGGALLLVGEVPSGVRVVPDRSVAPTGLDASGDGFTMRLLGLGADGRPLGLTGDGALLLESGRSAGVSGTGFRPNAPVKVFLFVPARELGTVMTDASGSFSGRVPLPADLPPGRYTLQTNGWTPNGQVRSLSLGVQARAAQSRTFATASTVVFFPELSPELTDTAKKTLRELVKGRKGRAVRTVVVGYVQQDQRTDNNKYLSTMRAVAISRYLKSLGVTGLVTTTGAGIAEQSGPAGRRASVTIRYTK